MQIKDKVVLITGGSEGIGACCAAEFRKRGARLALTARSEEKLRQVAGPDDIYIAGDLTDPALRREVVTRTLAHFGRIDILLNNAGVGLYSPAWRSPMDEVRHMFELNVIAPLDMTQLVVQQMRERRSGAIVNLGSIAGKITLPWFTMYSASKYAVGAMTDGLRMELRADGIHAMTVCPGYVRTRFATNVLAGDPPDSVRRAKQFSITPEQCANAIANGLERNARVIVTPRSGWALVIAERLFPTLVDRLMERLYHSQQREARRIAG